MKANQMNAVAKSIRMDRQQFESIAVEFRARWGKVYRNEVTAYLNELNERLKNDPKNTALKNERYAVEQVCAKIKGLNLDDEIRDLIKAMHDEDGVTFSCLTTDYIVNGLTGLGYIGTDDEGKPVVRELRKASKEATEKTWEPIVKWTEAKFGRYIRLATIRINESK